MMDIGRLRAARAQVPTPSSLLDVIGAISVAAVDGGGYDVWRRQMTALRRFAAAHRGPLVIVGDLNTTIHRAAYDDLASAGLHDAHDTLGKGLRPSFKVAASGFLARLGPLVRLDHALVSADVWPTAVEDLEPAGSDHRPFVVTLAVRPRRRESPGPPTRCVNASAPRTDRPRQHARGIESAQPG